MEHARLHGFPVPAAKALSPTDIVMERVTGPTMLTALSRRPWMLGRHASTLAGLHDRLHAISAPAWLEAPFGDGDSLLHLDFHPDNVILTESGPIVIDWPNAARGPAQADVAHTWIVMTCSPPLGSLYRRSVTRAGRSLFVQLFLRQFRRAAIAEWLPAAGVYRLGDRSLPEVERRALSRLMQRLEAEPG